MSLSRIVESYLQSLVSEDSKVKKEISPFVRSIATGKEMPNDLDYKTEYGDDLNEKYE